MWHAFLESILWRVADLATFVGCFLIAGVHIHNHARAVASKVSSTMQFAMWFTIIVNEHCFDLTGSHLFY